MSSIPRDPPASASSPHAAAQAAPPSPPSPAEDLVRAWLGRTWVLIVLRVLLAFATLAVTIWMLRIVARGGAIADLVPGLAMLVALGWASRRVAKRVLYTVSGKLAAFYLYAALWPILLLALSLPIAGYFVLGQVSSRIVDERLERVGDWADRSLGDLERAYWHARALGLSGRAAGSRALDEAFGRFREPGLSAWALDPSDRILASLGDSLPADPRAPAWLANRSFAGFVRGDSARLELRWRVPVSGAGELDELGARLFLQSRHVNDGLRTDAGIVPIAGTSLPGVATEPASRTHAERHGVRAYVNEGGVRQFFGLETGDHIVSLATAQGGRVVPVPRFLTRRRDDPRHPSPLRESIDSSLPIFRWISFVNPIDWRTGSVAQPAEAVQIRFAAGGAAAALRPSAEGAARVLTLIAGALLIVLLVHFVSYTTLGLKFAGAISGAIERLEQGVRAVRAGDFSRRIEPKEDDQLGAVAENFNHMSARLGALLEEQATLKVVEREIAIARDVQQRLFPREVPHTSALALCGICLPARSVSGDYYDFIPHGAGADVAIADVSGKGISAALLMASVHASLRGLYGVADSALPDPGEALTRLNRQLHDRVDVSAFVTLFLARYDGGGRLVYCSAGHNPAALIRSGRVEWLAACGPMLGPFPESVYATAEVTVAPGDVLVLYTDGVTEAVDRAGTFFGEERLAQVLEPIADQDAERIQGAVLAALAKWRNDAEPADDMTLAVLKITA